MGAKFSIYEFSENEIARIARLLPEFSTGVHGVDGRTMTKQVRDFATSWNIIEKTPNGYKFRDCFNWLDLPIESLWLLIEPMLNGESSRGYSLGSDKRWLDLNIYPVGHRFHCQRDIEDIHTILNKLSSHAYLYVQMAGSVWEITKRNREREVAGLSCPTI